MKYVILDRLKLMYCSQQALNECSGDCDYQWMPSKCKKGRFIKAEGLKNNLDIYEFDGV